MVVTGRPCRTPLAGRERYRSAAVPAGGRRRHAVAPVTPIHAIYVSNGVRPSNEEEATSKGVQQEVEVDGLVLLTEEAAELASPLEQNKGVAGRRERSQNAGAAKVWCLSTNGLLS